MDTKYLQHDTTHKTRQCKKFAVEFSCPFSGMHRFEEEDTREAPSVSKDKHLLVFGGKPDHIPYPPSPAWTAHNTGEESGVALIGVHNSHNKKVAESPQSWGINNKAVYIIVFIVIVIVLPAMPFMIQRPTVAATTCTLRLQMPAKNKVVARFTHRKIALS